MKKYKKLQFIDAVFAKGKLWSICKGLYALCSIDINTWEVEIVCNFADDKRFQFFEIKNILYYKDCLIMVSRHNANIVLLYLENNKKEYFIPPNCMWNETAPTADTFLFENSLWIIPRNAEKEGYIFDLDSKKYRRWKIQNLYKNALWTSICRVEENIWLIPDKTDKIVQYHLLSGKERVFSLGDKFQLHSIAFNNDCFLMGLWYSGDIICWSPEKGIKKVYNSQHLKDASCSTPYSKIVQFSGKTLLLPRFTSSVAIIDEANNSIENIKMPSGFQRTDGEGETSLMYGCADYKGSLYIFPWYGNMLVEFKREKLIGHNIEIEWSKYLYAYFRASNMSYPYLERSSGDLENYLSMIGSEELAGKKEGCLIENNTGENILSFFSTEKQ